MIILAVAAFMTLAAQAQVTWNVKAGFGVSQCVGLNKDGNAKGKFVWKAGVGAEIPLGGDFMLMPSLEYANKGVEWEYVGHEDDYYWKNDVSISFDYLQIPVLVSYRIPIKASNLTLKVGPYFAYAIGGRSKYSFTESGTPTETEKVSGKKFFDSGAKRFDAGIDVGIDWEYHKFVIGVEYERGFANMFSPSVEEGLEKIKINNSAAYFTVGYKF